MRIIDLSSPVVASGWEPEPADVPSRHGSVRGPAIPGDTDHVPLDWFFRPGVVLDLTARPPGAVNAEYLEREIRRIDYRPRPLDIVLLNTGASRWGGAARHVTESVRLDASAGSLLLDAGVRVVGTDAFRLDAPLDRAVERFRRTGDRGVPWPAHLAGRGQVFCQIERLANLDELPAHGFTVACFPLNGLLGTSRARAVAIVDAAL
jgi:cyclase